MFGCTSRKFEPAVCTSLCGMTSLFLNFRTVPGLTLSESDGSNSPELNDQEWQPCIRCLIVIVALPPAGAPDVTARATSAANPSAAPRIVFLGCMTSPSFASIELSVGRTDVLAIRPVPQMICGFTAAPLRRAADASAPGRAHPWIHAQE